MDNKDKKIDYKTLNDIIKSGNILLKICLTLMILSIIVVSVYLIDKTNIMSTITNILGILSPLFIGLILAWLLEPYISYFVKNKVNRKLSTFVVYLILLFLIVLILALIVPEFISQLNELIKKIPDFISILNNFINDTFKNFSDLDLDLSDMKDKLILSLNNFANSFTTETLTGIVNSVGTSIKTLTNIFLGVLIGFYLSLDFKKVSKYTSILIPEKFSNDLQNIGKSLNGMLRNYVHGTLLSCFFVLMLSLIGFLISGISSPLLFAVFCAITNIIPYFGPYIGGIPVVIVGFAINPVTGLICLITVLLVQFLEGNILHPLIVGKAISLHPITIMLSLLIFQYFFGIAGMIFAAPVVATLKIIIIFINNKYDVLGKIKI